MCIPSLPIVLPPMINIKGIGEGPTFFLHLNQHWLLYESLKYKLQASFYRFKNLIKLLRYCNFCKKFPIQVYGPF